MALLTTKDDSSSGFVGASGLGPEEESFHDFKIVANRGSALLVRASRHGRLWMLKGLTPDCRRSTLYARMLEKEFELAIGLQHPNIVAVNTIEDINGYGRCIVMEWVDGVTLDQWLACNHPRSEKRKTWRQILDAVNYMHSRQIVHRDLKPANIMVTRNGQNVKIIDFGYGDSDAHTDLKHPAGTRGYMSPEQADGGKPDVRNDIFSLGKILCDLRPFFGWRRVAAKCRGPIKKRYGSAELLAKGCRKAAVCYNSAIVMLCSIVIGLGGVLAWKLPDVNTASSKSKATVQTTCEVPTEAPIPETTNIPATPIPVMKPMEEPSETKPSSASEIEAIIAEGCNQVDKIVGSAALDSRLDTLTAQRYIMPLFNKTRIEVADYAQLKATSAADNMERYRIVNEIVRYGDEKYFIPFGRRIESLPL